MKHSKKLPIECANKYEWISDMKKLFENWRKHLNENNQAAVAVNQVIEKAQGNAYMMGSMEPDINELIASVTELIQGTSREGDQRHQVIDAAINQLSGTFDDAPEMKQFLARLEGVKNQLSQQQQA